MIAKFDYVFTDSMTWTNDRGKRMRLWIPNEVEVGDKQAFMEMLVARTVGILNNEPIDIYVNPTFLPAVIAKEYDTLWTDERMDKVIQAAAKNGVAIEINARYKLPSEKFIRQGQGRRVQVLLRHQQRRQGRSGRSGLQPSDGRALRPDQGRPVRPQARRPKTGPEEGPAQIISEDALTWSYRGDWRGQAPVRSSQPSSVMRISSSMRTPSLPGR